jgi:hypothetical protein
MTRDGTISVAIRAEAPASVIRLANYEAKVRQGIGFENQRGSSQMKLSVLIA